LQLLEVLNERLQPLRFAELSLASPSGVAKAADS